MGFSPFGGFDDAMLTIVPVIVVIGFVVIGFVVVIGLIVARSIQGAKQWKRNNDSPVLTVTATMVTKRMNVSHHRHNTRTDNIHHSTSSTTYYATFEVESGDRIEFVVRDSEYSILVENDKGQLTFQGTRYLGFERGQF